MKDSRFESIEEARKEYKKLIDKGQPKSPYFTKEKAEADAAKKARRKCLK